MALKRLYPDLLEYAGMEVPTYLVTDVIHKKARADGEKEPVMKARLRLLLKKVLMS